jgi:hypothetical protein
MKKPRKRAGGKEVGIAGPREVEDDNKKPR